MTQDPLVSLRPMVIGPWTVEVDPEATRSIYAEIPDGAEVCTCEHCQHFAAHRGEIYTDPIRNLLTDLGIDYRREAELYELDPRPESHSCRGWFHLVGRVVRGPRPDTTADFFGSATRLPDPVSIGEGFGVLVYEGRSLMKPAMESANDRGLPVITLEFETTSHVLEVNDETHQVPSAEPTEDRDELDAPI